MPSVLSGVSREAVADGSRGVSATLDVWLRVPSKPALRRAPRYVSPSTKSLTVREGSKTIGTFDVAAKSSACRTRSGATLCQFKASVTTGKNRLFTITAYDATGGKGQKLGVDRLTQTIVSGSNVLPLTLSGVVASISVGIAAANAIPAGTSASIPVVVMAKDADGNLIVGEENYATAVTLADSDTSGATLLSRNGGAAASSVTVNSPADQVTLQYSGRSLDNASIAPSATGVTSLTPASFSPAPAQLGDFILPSTSAYAIEPNDIAAGNDGNLWITFYTYGLTNTVGIAKMTMSGTFTTYFAGQAPATNLPNTGIGDIVGAPAGSSKAAWFTAVNQVGALAPDGSVTMYNAPASLCGGSLSFLVGIISDGSTGFWVDAECTSGGDAVLHVASDGMMVASAQLSGFDYSGDLTLGKDGKLYVAGRSPGVVEEAIAQYTVSGSTVTSSSMAVSPNQGYFYYIAVGADGTLYVTDGGASSADFARLKPGSVFAASTFTSLALPQGGLEPNGIVALPDGTMWMDDTAYGFSELTQVVPSATGGNPAYRNVLLSYNVAVGTFSPQRIRVGPDGNLYVLNQAYLVSSPNVSGDIVKFAY